MTDDEKYFDDQERIKQEAELVQHTELDIFDAKFKYAIRRYKCLKCGKEFDTRFIYDDDYPSLEGWGLTHWDVTSIESHCDGDIKLIGPKWKLDKFTSIIGYGTSYMPAPRSWIDSQS